MKPASPLFRGKPFNGSIVDLNQYSSEPDICYIFISSLVAVHDMLWLRFERFVYVRIQFGYCFVQHKNTAIA